MVDLTKEIAREYARLKAQGDIAQEFWLYAQILYKLNLTTETGVFVHPIEMPKGKVKIAIIIDDDTRIKQIEKSWEEIGKWRNALSDWQDVDQKEVERFYGSLSNAQKRGVSYSQLANRINQQITEFLLDYAGWLRDCAINERQFGSGNYHLWFYDYLTKPEHHKPQSFYQAKKLLSYCRPRLSEGEIHTLMQLALESIQSIEPPFLPNEPVQGSRDVRERIAYWRKKQAGVGNTS